MSTYIVQRYQVEIQVQLPRDQVEEGAKELLSGFRLLRDRLEGGEHDGLG